MNISIIGMLLTLLLVLVPLYFFHYFKVPLIRSTIISTLRMVVQMSLIGLYLEFLFSYNNWLVNVLWFVLMVLVASVTAVNRTRLRMRLMLMPIAVGLGVGALVVCMYALFVVLRLSNPFDARYFIPVVGILLGNMLGVNVLSLSTYYQGLQRERQLYFYLLGNGATRLEALTPFIRQAIEKSFMPCIANMAVMGLVSFPGTMIGQILGGATPDTAVRYQILISCITFCAPMVSLIVTLYLAHRFSFDKHGRLLNVLKAD